MPYKPPKHTIIQISKDPSAFTFEQESPFFDYFNDLTTTKEHIQATQDATQISSNHIKSNSVNKSIKLTNNPSSAMPPAETYHQARNGANNFLHFAKRITSSPTISSKKELRTTLSKKLTKKPTIQDHHSEHNYNNDSNNEVAASDSFKIPAPNADDLHNDKKGIIQTALERAFQGTSTIKNPTNTRVEIVRTVDAIKELIKDTHFSTLRKREDHKSNSDEDVKSSESSAIRSISTFLKAPRIDEDKAKATTAKHINDHCQNREFFTECPPDHPEQAKPLPSTTITQLPTTSANPSRISFLPSPENVILFLRHHFNAVICDNNLVLTAATPPDTNYCQTPGISLPTPKNENTSTSDDNATNCPVPTSEIGPMSERDPPAKNAVSTNFNDDISDNGLDIIKMSTTNSIYSQQSENNRNSVHSYASELTRTFDTTHTSTTDGIRTTPMTDISIKTIKEKETKFPPPTDSLPAPPFTDTTHTDTTNNTMDTLETTILAHTQTTSAFRHPATKNYAATDIKHKKTTQFSVPDPPFLNSKTAAPDSYNPFHFLPISETSHRLHPIIESDNYRTSGSQHLSALTDILNKYASSVDRATYMV
jgi:hypothetical protein